MKNRIIVYVSGGLVQGIFASNPIDIDIDVLDMDNMKCEEDEESLARMRKMKREIDGGLEQVY